ncbi:hypothetical protein, partial [Streptomyces sp. NPDC086010]|uniref:hypothetical protein n=1 Tax=Streptomyces sp. NPDC086010 TaxID=3365745 RepID=UPI0037D5F7A1
NVLRQYAKIQRLDLIAAAMRHEGIQRYAIMPPHLAHTLQRLTMDEGLPSARAALMKSPRDPQGHLKDQDVQDWADATAVAEDQAITQIRQATGISLSGVSVEEIARILQLRDKHHDIDRYFKMNHAEGVSDISNDSPRRMRVKERRSVGNDPAVTVLFYHDQPLPVQNEWLRSYFDTAIDSVVSAVEAFQSAGVTMQEELHVHLFRYNSKFYISRNKSAGIEVEQREERERKEKLLAEAFSFADSIVIYPLMMDFLTTTAVIEPEPNQFFPMHTRRPHFAVLLHEMAHVVSVGHSDLERTASTFAPGVEGALALFGPYGRRNTQEALAEFMTALLLGADEPGGRFHTHAASAHREKAHELYRALGGTPVRQVLPAPALTAEELTWLTERVNTLTTAVVDSTIVQQVYDTLPTWTKWQALPTLADQVRKHLPGTPAEPWMLDHAAWEYYTERHGEMAEYVLRETLKLLGEEHPHLADTDRIKHAFRRIDETATPPSPATMAALKDAVLSDQNPTDPHHTEEGAHLPAAEPFNQESFPSPIPPPATPAPLQSQPTLDSAYATFATDNRPTFQEGLESASLAQTRPSNPHRERENHTPRPLAEHAAWNTYAAQPETAAQANFVMRHTLDILKKSAPDLADLDLIKSAYGQLDNPLRYNSAALAQALANIVLTGRPSVALPGGAGVFNQRRIL